MFTISFFILLPRGNVWIRPSPKRRELQYSQDVAKEVETRAHAQGC
jgi:hypothetical protein